MSYDVQFCSPMDCFLLQKPDSAQSLFRQRFTDPQKLMRSHLETIESLLYPDARYPQRRDSAATRRVLLILDDLDGVAATRGGPSDDSFSIISLSSNYCKQVARDKTPKQWVREISGVILHELVHTVQLDGQGKAPGGLIEGLADFCRLEAGLGAEHWKEEETADTWDAGYECVFPPCCQVAFDV